MPKGQAKKIPGGYYIMARQAKDSDIAHAPPHVREIWHYLIREANHQGKKKYGEVLDRGQVLKSYEDIREDLHWMVGWRKQRYSKDQCETAMKFLRKPRRNGSMVTTRRTTRGLIITIINYDYYQNPKNYESHNCDHNGDHNEAYNLPQTPDTIDKNGKNGKKERRKEYSSDSDEMRLASYLFAYIKRNNPEAKNPNYQKWAHDFNKAIRLDGRTVEKLKAVIEFSQNDSFWQSNILSASKLRDQYDQLVVKMKKPNTPHPTTYAQCQDLERRQMARATLDYLEGCNDVEIDGTDSSGRDECIEHCPDGQENT